MPTLAAVRLWLRASPTDVSDEQLAQVVEGELDDQSKACRLPADVDAYPAVLAQALYRRVGRELAGRQVPLGLVGDPASEYGSSTLASWDAEVERLEGRYRVVVFG